MLKQPLEAQSGSLLRSLHAGNKVKRHEYVTIHNKHTVNQTNHHFLFFIAYSSVRLLPTYSALLRAAHKSHDQNLGNLVLSFCNIIANVISPWSGHTKNSTTKPQPVVFVPLANAE